MVNAFRRNSFGLSLALHALVLLALSWVRMHRLVAQDAPQEIQAGTVPVRFRFR